MMIIRKEQFCLACFYTVTSLIFPCYSFNGTPYFAVQYRSATSLPMVYRSTSSSRIGGRDERSKRQERVGHLVQSEIAQILHQGSFSSKNTDGTIDDFLRQQINIISVDMSPDLRQARITVSIIGKEVIEKRRAYGWLVRNTKYIRHALSKRLSHMKSCPNLTFVQADVAAAVDIMNLIDKISKDGLKRENLQHNFADDDSDWIDEFDDEFDEDFD